MQLTTVFTALLAAAGTSFAAPAPEPADRNMMAAASTWTIQSFRRVCAADDSYCTYTYRINANDGTAVPSCNYRVNRTSQTVASRTSYQNVRCGTFTVGSTWSGQFGANQGFQTLSVVRNRQIVYPAYTDAQLAGGRTVSPDQSYTPSNLP